MSPYEILGVEPGASDQEIKAAYRSLAQKSHPDRAGGSTGDFQKISDAFAILSDPDKRSYYDSYGVTDVPPSQPADDFIATMFESFIESGSSPMDIVQSIKNNCIRIGNETRRQVINLEAKKKNLQHKLGRVKCSDGENIFDKIIRTKIDTTNRTIVGLSVQIKTLDAVMQKLNSYSDHNPDIKVSENQFSGNSASNCYTTFGGTTWEYER